MQDWARSPAAGAGLSVIGPFHPPAEQACDGKLKLILFLKVSKNWKTDKNLLLLSYDGFAPLVQSLVAVRTFVLSVADAKARLNAEKKATRLCCGY